jgi:phage terminase large subunit-like protein
VIVGVDPAGGGGTKTSDETGIVVVGLGDDDRIYILEDLSRKCSSAEWGQVVVEAVKRWHADCAACERNWGGDMVKTIVQQINPNIKVKLPVAHRDKGSRAAMVSPYWQRHHAYHVGDPRLLVKLEDQMCSYDPTLPRTAQDSPDRMDALVWGILELVGDGSDRQTLRNLAATEDLWDEIESDLRQDLDHDDIVGLIETAFGRLAA